jgi:hypothetical protein
MSRNIIVFKIKISRPKKGPSESVYALQYLIPLAEAVGSQATRIEGVEMSSRVQLACANLAEELGLA